MTIRPQLRHVGVYAFDLDALVEFYTRVFGLVVTDRATRADGVTIAFMSSDPAEHHQVVIADGRDSPEGSKSINQISFRVPSLDDLRDFHARLVTEGVEPDRAVTHGNAWSIYFTDPEGNPLEVYSVSPWHVAQPFAEPVDLTKPASQILAETEAAIVAAAGTAMPIEEHAAVFEEGLRAT